jgi:hypothetical protein
MIKKILLIFLIQFIHLIQINCIINTNNTLTYKTFTLDEDLYQAINIDLNRERCRDILPHEHNISKCPRTFDGILCWNETDPDMWSYAPCPTWFIGFVNKKAKAKRFCQANGKWTMKSTKNISYTDYTACFESNTDTSLYIKHLPIVKLIGKVGFTLSLASLVIAIVLLISLK